MSIYTYPITINMKNPITLLMNIYIYIYALSPEIFIPLFFILFSLCTVVKKKKKNLKQTQRAILDGNNNVHMLVVTNSPLLRLRLHFCCCCSCGVVCHAGGGGLQKLQDQMCEGVLLPSNQ